MKTVTVYHRDAKADRKGNAIGVTIEVDVAKEFSIADLKRCHNVHLERRNSDPAAMVPEPHEFTPDMLKFFEVWNHKVGWIGFFKIPERLVWGSPQPQPEFDQESALNGDVEKLTRKTKRELQPA